VRWRSALLTASSALLLAGCGGAEHAEPTPPPRIPAVVAERLAAEADAVARLAPGSCAARDAAARFRSHVISAVGSIPSRYQEPLLSAANDLARRAATCSEPKPKDDEDEPEEHGKKRGQEKDKEKK
jgi:hypothetical protein